MVQVSAYRLETRKLMVALLGIPGMLAACNTGKVNNFLNYSVEFTESQIIMVTNSLIRNVDRRHNRVIPVDLPADDPTYNDVSARWLM